MAEHKLVLIDGHALAYRVFFGLPIDAFTTKSGEPTNATFGFTRNLFDIIFSKNPPKYLAVSFDVGRTFRDDMFEAYKGTREKMPDELRLQIERIKEVVAALNIPILTLDGFEADDVLGTIAAQAKPLGVPVHILTGDRDLLQLVDDNTTVELPPSRFSKGPSVYDHDAVIKKMGVRPDQIVDYKAIVGDSSDNIPGVKGVGEKTVVKLLAEYQTLDTIYENLENIGTRFSKKLETDKENAYLSQKLARIVTDAPIDFDLSACEAHDFDPYPVFELFRQLEFRSLTRNLQDALGQHDIDLPEEEPEPEAVPTETIIVRTAKQLKDLVKKLNSAAEISFDLETDSLNKQDAKIVGFCISVEAPVGYYIPVGHIDGDSQANSGQMGLFATEAKLLDGQLPLATVIEAIRPAFTNPEIGKIAHNAKYDYAVLANHGLKATPITFDTMIAEWLTNPGSKFKGLKQLANHRLGVQMTEIETLIGKGKSQITFDRVAIEDGAPYGAADADITLRLKEKLAPEIEKLGFQDLNKMEMALIPILADMEDQGVAIDPEFFSTMSADLTKRLGELEGEIHEIAGHAFNINSTQQLSNVLFIELELPHERLRKTKSGHYSTASDVLENLRPIDETGIVQRIVEYRELGKLKSTYVDALPTLVNARTKRIHTSFNQTGSVTGRIASNTPNLQNIPIRTEVGQKIRRGFLPRPGWKFVAADYSQVELRILAHISQDPALLEAFREERDIHRATAASVHGINEEEVTYNQRRFAKAVNFGLIYGMGAFRLARDSDLTLAEAREFIDTYFARFPGVQKYLDETKESAATYGFVETLLGRRRYFDALKHGNNSGAIARRAAEREAVNYPIQGSAADIIKVAMIRLHAALAADFEARMILQVHDELVLEVPDHEVDAVRALIIETMSDAYELDVPLKVEANVGTNWLELKD